MGHCFDGNLNLRYRLGGYLAVGKDFIWDLKDDVLYDIMMEVLLKLGTNHISNEVLALVGEVWTNTVW